MTGGSRSRDRAATRRRTSAHAGTWTTDGRCVFDDVRRFGRIAVVHRGVHQTLPTLAALGPEPFDDEFTPSCCAPRIHASSSGRQDTAALPTGRRGRRQHLRRRGAVAGRGAPRSPATDTAPGAAACATRSVTSSPPASSNGGTTLRNYRDAEGGSGQNQRYLRLLRPFRASRASDAATRCGGSCSMPGRRRSARRVSAGESVAMGAIAPIPSRHSAGRPDERNPRCYHCGFVTTAEAMIEASSPL